MALNRNQALKLLLSQQVYDIIPEHCLQKPDKPNNYYSMYDLLGVLGVQSEELEYVENFMFKDL